MDNLDEIIKNQMIFSYENNLTFRNQLVTIFNNHYYIKMGKEAEKKVTRGQPVR